MSDEVISLEDKIMLLINGRMDQNSYEECQSIQLSKELKLSRNQVTRLLNELFNDKKLIKIKTSPVLYLSRGSLESKYKKKLSSDEYKSLDELEAELNNQTELKNFENNLCQINHQIIISELRRIRCSYTCECSS